MYLAGNWKEKRTDYFFLYFYFFSFFTYSLKTGYPEYSSKEFDVWPDILSMDCYTRHCREKVLKIEVRLADYLMGLDYQATRGIHWIRPFSTRIQSFVMGSYPEQKRCILAGMKIRIRSDPLIFGQPDPDPTCNNGFIKKKLILNKI